MRARTTLRNALRGLSVLLGGSVALSLLILLALLLGPVRQVLLERTLSRADRALPGNLYAARAAWGLPLDLELEGLHWISDVDTLLVAKRVRVSVDPVSLLRRDIDVRTLEIAQGRFDLASIRRQFPSREDGAGEALTKDGQGFPRSGSVPGLPSIRLRWAELDLAAEGLGNTLGTVRLESRAEVDLGHDRRPHVRLAGLKVVSAALGLDLQTERFVAELGNGEIEGKFEGRWTPIGEFALEARSVGADSLTVLLVEDATRPPPAGTGVHLTASLQREGFDLQAADFELRARLPSSERLREVPLLEPILASMPDWAEPRLDARGNVGLGETPYLSAHVELAELDGIEELRTELRFAPNELDLRDLHLRAGGLQVEGALGQSAAGYEGELRARVQDLEWLRLARVEPPVIDPLELEFAARLSGSKNEPRLSVWARGRAGLGQVQADSLHAELDLQLAAPLRARIDALVETRDLRVSLSGVAHQERDGWDLNLQRAVVDDARFASLPPDAAGTSGGRLYLEPSQRRLLAEELLVRGNLGEARLAGLWHEGANSSVVLRIEGPNEPEALLSRLGLSAAQCDSLRTSGLRLSRYSAEIELDVDSSSGDRSWTAQSRLHLPGPAQFGTLLPQRFELSSWQDLRAQLVGEGVFAAESSSASIVMDFDETTWISSDPISLRWSPTSSELDSLSIGLAGMHLTAAASLQDSFFAGGATVEIQDAPSLLTTLGLPAESTFIAGRLGASVRGPLGRLDGVGDAQLSVGTPDIQIPLAFVDAHLQAGQLAGLRLELPEGGRWKQADLDHLRMELGGPVVEGERTLRWAGLQLRSRSVQWEQIAVLGRADSAWTVRTDSLQIRWRGQDLTADQPFLVQIDSTDMKLRGLSLHGSLGQVIGEGVVRPDSAHVGLRMALDLPPGPPPFGLTVPWPDSLQLRIDSSAVDRLDLGLHAPGLGLGPEAELRLFAELSAAPDSLRGSLELLRPDRSPMLWAQLRAPLLLRSAPWNLKWSPDALALRADLNDVPLPSRAGAPRQVWNEFLARRGPNPLRVDGQMRVDGLPGLPVGTVALRVRLPEETPLETHAVDIDARMEAGGRVAAEAIWRSPQAEIARAELRLGAAPQTAAWAERSLEASMQARAFSLASVEWMLPPGISLDGQVDLDGAANGTLENPRMSGTFDATEVEIRLSDGTLARADAHLELRPQQQRPKLAGHVDVQSAILILPESQRNLYPASGEALLWSSAELVSMQIAPTDTVAAGDEETTGADGSGPPAEPLADIDIVVRIPPNARLVGRRLEVEMGGELRIRVSEGRPALMGELTAHRGHLDLLGNRFTMSQGTVTFYGDDEVNPVLNLILETVKDQTTVRVIIEGTALKPRIRLESNPAMSEADIMSYLLFGSDSNSLDGFQTEWVRTQAMQLSQMLGLDVERTLSQGLGLDVVRIGRSQRDPEVQALSAGKYIDPKVLITYEQSLTRSESFYVILRWWITREITLETNVGNVDPSNVQVNWRRRY